MILATNCSVVLLCFVLSMLSAYFGIATFDQARLVSALVAIGKKHVVLQFADRVRVRVPG